MRSMLRRWAISLASVLTLTLLAGSAAVVVAQDATPEATPVATPVVAAVHPAHIHTGSCDSLGEVVFPLADLAMPAADEGSGVIPIATSVTVVDASLEQILSAPHAVNVHESYEAIGNYIACGNIGGSPVGADLVVGLMEMNNSGFSGVVWLHDNGDGTTTVTIFLGHGLVGVSVEEPPVATPPAEATPATPAPEATPVAETVTVESHDIYFQPAEITIPANTPVTFVLPNLGVAPHNFVVDELDIRVELDPGETDQVEITAPAGEYEFYCDVPGHREAGMVGKLIVE